MTRHTLFLVHGMGSHEGTQWSDEIWNKLVELSERYPHFQTKKKLSEYAEPFPVEYDYLINKALDRWDTQAKTFGEFTKENELRHGVSLDWLDGVSGDDTGFLLSHIADVVIYRFFRFESGQIRDNVTKDIFKEIGRKRAQQADARFSLMAHSLGTSVAHDALAKLGALPRIGENVNAFGTKNFSFRSIHMLANVSRLLQTEPKVYESVVRPGSNSAQNRYCGRMYCHSHELDPFTKPMPFEPVSWGNNFRITNLRHYRGWNVHGWLHYLDNPRVHIPLLRSITNSSAVSPKQEREAVNNYSRFGKNLLNLDVAQGKIAELHALAQGIDENKGLKENFEALLKMWNVVKELKELAGGTWATLEGSVS